MHSPKFNTVKKYYVMGVWTITQVHKAVEKNWITPEEFYEITGQIYR